MLTERLYPYLLEIGEAANERMDILMPQLMRVAEQMKWSGLADDCKAQLEEIINLPLEIMESKWYSKWHKLMALTKRR